MNEKKNNGAVFYDLLLDDIDNEIGVPESRVVEYASHLIEANRDEVSDYEMRLFEFGVLGAIDIIRKFGEDVSINKDKTVMPKFSVGDILPERDIVDAVTALNLISSVSTVFGSLKQINKYGSPKSAGSVFMVCSRYDTDLDAPEATFIVISPAGEGNKAMLRCVGVSASLSNSGEAEY